MDNSVLDSNSLSSSPPRQLSIWILVLLVSLGASLVYLNTLGNGFVFDDLVFITRGKLTRSVSNIPTMFGLTGEGLSYRPVRLASYAIDRGIYSLERPWGFHLSNLIYHTLTSIAVFFLFLRVTNQRWIATVGALLFGLHPIHVDAVTYVSGRKDVLCTLFYLCALCVSARWSSSPIKGVLKTSIATAMTIGLFALAILSKEMAATLPALIFCIALTQNLLSSQTKGLARDPEESWLSSIAKTFRSISPILLPVVLIAAVGCVYVLSSARGTAQGWHGGSIASNFATSARVLVYYLQLLAFPLKLIGDYHIETFPLSSGFSDPAAIVSVLILAGLIAVTFWVGRRQPLILLGSLWFFVTVLPVAHIIPHHELVGERFLYLPSVGFCLAAAVFLHKLAVSRFSKVAPALCGVIFLLFGTRIVTRNFDYKDDLTFWKSVVSAAPMNSRAQMYLGHGYFYAGKQDRAARAMERAVEITPDLAHGHYNLAYVYESMGRHGEALKAYSRELETYENKDARFRRAQLLAKRGRYFESIESFEEMLEIYPKAHGAMFTIGLCYEKLRKPDLALEWFRKVQEMKPEHEKAIAKIRNYERRAATLKRQESTQKPAQPTPPNRPSVAGSPPR